VTALRPPRLLLPALLLLAALPAAAQELYLWTDEDGVRHISDRRPDGAYDVDVQRGIARPDAPVEMRNVGSEREPEWRFLNRLYGPVSVQVAFSEADNVTATPALPAVLVVPGRAHRSVKVAPGNPLRDWRYGITMQSVPGPIDAQPDHGLRYRLPFPPEQAIVVGQGFGGTFSHTAPQSLHAVDFSLPTGTPVLAARGGVVMDVERWFHQTGDDPERDGPRANYVRVLHGDGSMAVYAHLDYNSITVQPGAQLAPGQRLGRSGNTGYSTGPHLHFAVQVNRDMELVSIPFRMVAPDGRELWLDDGGVPAAR